MGKRRGTALPASFFARETVVVARELLGKFLVRRTPDGGEISAMITDVEVYDGFRDRGSHASRGKTPRNTPMFGRAGNWYMYFTYGMHWMLNIVTRPAGYPAAVLLRGVDGAPGPARLTKSLGIDKAFNALPSSRKTGLWIEDRGVTPPLGSVHKGPRIGIAYAGRYWARRHLRFWFDPARFTDAGTG